MQPCPMGKIPITDLQPGQIPYALQLGCGENHNLRIVHIVQRAFQQCGCVPMAPILNQVGTVLDGGIDVSVRRDDYIGLSIATDGYDVGQAVPSVVLRVNIPKPVVQPPAPLGLLRAQEHGEVRGVPLLHQGREVLKPCVLVEDGLRPVGLVATEHLLNLRIRQCTRGPQLFVHCRQFLEESGAKVLPEN